MKTDSNTRWRAKASRMRGQGQWALVIGFIALLGCLVGMVQFWMYGAVSIRPKHDPVSGDAATEMLLFLFFISVAFVVYGSVMVRLARRRLKR